jgi:polyhydroxybutyrate depolymerase
VNNATRLPPRAAPPSVTRTNKEVSAQHKGGDIFERPLTRRSRRAKRALFFVAVGAGALLTSLASAAGAGIGPRSVNRSKPEASPQSPQRSGCGTSGGGSATLSVKIDGHERTSIVHVPTGYTGTHKLPLVLNMHGSGATALDQELFSGMDATSNDDDFIVVYPQGVIPDGSGYDWNVPGEPLVGGRSVPKGSPDDVTFLTDLVGVISQRYCVDLSRVYATGFSGGARMASQLACDASTTFAAVAPVSGLRRPTPCKPARPVPVLSFHGTADPVDPYNGNGEGYWTYSVPTAAKDWATEDGCSTTATTSQPAKGVTLTKYTRCKGTAIVELYTIKGEGHEWPGGPKLPKVLTSALGPQSNAIDADSIIWAFFAAHPMS